MFPSNPPPPQRNNPYDPQNHRLRRRSNVDPSTGRTHNVYYPKIYTYKCYGKFTTSSIDTVNHGKCHGIPTKLETLYNEQIRISRVEALKRFTSLTADVDLDDYQNHSTTGDLDEAGGEFNQQSVFLSPALIYKYDTAADGAASKASVIKTDGTNEGNVFEKAALLDDILPEEELIVEQSWTCYGVTEVEYLALENVNTGESKLVAVAPQNTGVSIREIETDDTVRTLTRCSLGWIDILHDSNTILVDDENENDEKQTEHADGKRPLDDSKQDDDKLQEPRGLLPQFRMPSDLQSSIHSADSVARKSLERTYEFSKVVLEHMKFNATWLYRNLQDDFPARTVTAGKSIVTQLPRSVELTTSAMSKILRRMFGGDDDDDDDDNYPPGGGRRF
jgi:hypothetical protein